MLSVCLFSSFTIVKKHFKKEVGKSSNVPTLHLTLMLTLRPNPNLNTILLVSIVFKNPRLCYGLGLRVTQSLPPCFVWDTWS